MKSKSSGAMDFKRTLIVSKLKAQKRKMKLISKQFYKIALEPGPSGPTAQLLNKIRKSHFKNSLENSARTWAKWAKVVSRFIMSEPKRIVRNSS